MAKCEMCGTDFQVEDARSDYSVEFSGDPDYDDSYEGEVCGACAVVETYSNIDAGRAIGMVNGEEEYDEEFVEKHL